MLLLVAAAVPLVVVGAEAALLGLSSVLAGVGFLLDVGVLLAVAVSSEVGVAVAVATLLAASVVANDKVSECALSREKNETHLNKMNAGIESKQRTCNSNAFCCRSFS